MYVCKSEVTKVPLKYRLASRKKTKELLQKLPEPKEPKKELIIKTSHGKIIF